MHDERKKPLQKQIHRKIPCSSFSTQYSIIQRDRLGLFHFLRFVILTEPFCHHFLHRSNIFIFTFGSTRPERAQ